MIRAPFTFTLLAAALAVSACGERPQSEASPRKKADTRASAGADAAYTAAGWQAGDDASWQNQIRARTQGQNEYSRVQSSSPSATGGVVAAPMPATMPAGRPASAP